MTTELFTTEDPHDARLARSAVGLLGEFNRAGVIEASDLHVAVRVGALAGEADERVLLAVALAVRAVRRGAVCLDLARADFEGDAAWPEPAAWLAAVTASPLCAASAIRVEEGLVYLDRYWREEAQVCEDLVARTAQPPPHVDRDVLQVGGERIFPEAGYADQRAAAQTAALRWTSVLTGGPGTGKTTAVAGLLALLAEQEDAPRVALAAPTGKASARLEEAVRQATAALPEVDRARLGSLNATTLHRLLGSRPDTRTRFRHHRGNRLPHDIVVVDESSMVSLTMMARLIEAVRPDARLVLVGDPDQLASVEAGAVLADLVAGLDADSVAQLRTSHRFGEQIGALAGFVRDGDADQAWDLLTAGGPEIEFIDAQHSIDVVRALGVSSAQTVRAAAEAGDGAAAISALERHRLLCAHREGPQGAAHWNRLIERELGVSREWYAGRPLLVTANDYGLGLFNGDTGVVIRDGDGLRAVIAGSGREFATTRLAEVETVFAMTVHKSQGSQAEEVTVVLPPEDSRLLSRELFYTAITRAQVKVRVVGTEATVRSAIGRRALRASGLRQRLARSLG